MTDGCSNEAVITPEQRAVFDILSANRVSSILNPAARPSGSRTPTASLIGQPLRGSSVRRRLYLWIRLAFSMKPTEPPRKPAVT